MELSGYKRRALVSIVLPIAAAVSLLLLPSLVPAAYAADRSVPGGMVERVSGTVITVYGSEYDIGQARVRGTSGEHLSFPDVTRGKKVDLLLKNGKVATVVVYPPAMLE